MAEFAERFLHVDMDAFFVEVERLRDPGLHGRPVIVGGLGARGVVASASYEARAQGVQSAMPMREARRRCPAGHFVRPDHASYRAVSSDVFTLIRSFTPYVEGLSIDEAFLDVAGLRRHYESPEAAAAAIRRGIRSEIGIPSSVGIARVKFIAKIASSMAKPDGLLKVPAGTEADFLEPLSIRRLWGVGEVTHAALEQLGVATVGELRRVPRSLLEDRLGAGVGGHVAEMADGRDPRTVVTDAVARSLSVEETYERDLVERTEVDRELLRLCDRLSRRLRRAGVAARTITLKLRFADFSTVTRSETVLSPVALAPDLRDCVARLRHRARIGSRPIRLLGIGGSALVAIDEPRQLSWESGKRSAAANAAEQVRDRFGDQAIRPAAIVPPPPTLEPGSDEV